jgi:hypothetical protein
MPPTGDLSGLHVQRSPDRHDTHGEPHSNPNATTSYSKGPGVEKDEGTLTAAFDGSHGWFWRNRTDKPITVTLKTQGDYAEIKRMK